MGTMPDGIILGHAVIIAAVAKLAKGRHGEKKHSGKCAWGCCNSRGHDAGWTNYCPSWAVSKGQSWSKTHKGSCQWGCCNSRGHDAGWTNYCPSWAVSKGQSWSAVRTG